ncbi:cardiolipin synthase [Paenibacillus sp. J2TS4]|uniref:cardiolipin synthase n=1 Tax=Paenibacillus sp. J2TS4 TaxID=2807194 RepID=UPI001B149E08|nr:cardiolipin synthase [Paenibacillus sp. J2TS4]GIP35760.1 cardiolipin synthase 2 [Paenibacillus sp. J2TS4]
MRRSIQIAILTIIVAALLYYLNLNFGHTLATFFSVTTSLAVLFVGLIIFMENRHPSSTVAWILVLALVPVVGFFFYLMFGQNYRKRRNFNRKALRDAQAYTFIENRSLANEHILAKFPESQQNLFRLSQTVGKSPISFSTETEILTNGDATFSAILNELEKAVHHIHMEYYIYRNDEIGTQIQQVLIQKAKAGVKVRFLFDAVGSLKLPTFFLDEMKQAGVEVVAFAPVYIPLLSNKVNFRNHRKIVVIDGEVGFIGGLNVGDEYLSRSTTYGFWRDTHILVRGEAVRTLQIIFLQDWHYMTGEAHLNPEYLSPSLTETQGDGAVQMIASGPDNEWRTLKNLFFSMITSAKRSIWIATPYFIPDDDIYTALQVAALSGVDVKLLFPKKPDKWLPYFASHSYFRELLDAGVQIYEYEKGFMHSKILIIDGEMASIGSANMDMRSFHLNFEVNAFIYQTESTRTLVSDFQADLQDSTQINRDKFVKKWYIRFMESAARLLSPLL